MSRLAAALIALVMAPLAQGQVVVKNDAAALTLEAWGNAAGAIGAADARSDDEDWQVDGAVRALGLVKLAGLGRAGVRVVAEGLGGVTDDAGLGERSLLWSGSLGRLEYGDRQGLPDVLTGYAPNPFTFTTAEFGPASGLSLDPGGGIVQRFVADDAARAVDELSVLGYGTSLSGDRSRKLLYVSPKRAGWLAGVSYASDADGADTHGLVQAGLVHEVYRGQGTLRAGASWAHLDTNQGGGLDSWSAGLSLDLDQTWLLGLAATWNPDDSASPVPGWRSDAFGVTASANWNHGPWTVGGFVQDAQGSESAGVEADELHAVETGVSYRTSTKIRMFLSWYHYRLDGRSEVPAADDDLLIAGARITL